MQALFLSLTLNSAESYPISSLFTSLIVSSKDDWHVSAVSCWIPSDHVCSWSFPSNETIEVMDSLSKLVQLTSMKRHWQLCTFISHQFSILGRWSYSVLSHSLCMNSLCAKQVPNSVHSRTLEHLRVHTGKTKIIYFLCIHLLYLYNVHNFIALRVHLIFEWQWVYFKLVLRDCHQFCVNLFALFATSSFSVQNTAINEMGLNTK